MWHCSQEEERGGGGAIGPDGARHWTETLFGAEQAYNSKPKISNWPFITLALPVHVPFEDSNFV